MPISPATWPSSDLEHFLGLASDYPLGSAALTSKTAAVVGSSGPLAVRAGIEALRDGGTAIDAALTTAITQIALCAGSWSSYAGLLSLLCFNPTSGVHALNAQFNTLREENEPQTIPSDSPSARSALVGGFIAGAQEAHSRFGKLPWARLFDAAIYIAEEGFALPAELGASVAYREDVLTRRAETAKIFTHSSGRPIREGDHFAQPDLVRTLELVAAEGAGCFYEGGWARAFVDAVRSDGGRLTMEDLGSYRPLWTTPTRGMFRGHQVFAPGLPDQSGYWLLESLNLAEEAGLADAPHFTEDPDRLYWAIRIARERWRTSSVSLDDRITRAHARARWAELSGLDEPTVEATSPHTDSVVVVDAQRQIAALTHTINTGVWGGTGLFVEGVSIPDSASRVQKEIAQVGPGGRLPNPLLPVIVLQSGRPVLASSAMGSGIHEATFQGVLGVLGHGLDVHEVVSGPSFHAPAFDVDEDGDEEVAQYVAIEGFRAEVLDGCEARGMRLERRPLQDVTWRGYWTAVQLPDSADEELRSASSPCLGAWAEGY